MVLAFVEYDNDAVSDVSLELLTMARDLAAQVDEPLSAVVIGDVGDVDDVLAAYGVTDLYCVEHEQIDEHDYAPEAWAECICQLTDELSPEILIAPGTDRGHEVLAHVSAKRDLPMAANCLDVTPGEPYTIERQNWGGSLIEHAQLTAETKLLTVPPHEIGAEPASEGMNATVHGFTPTVDDSQFRVHVSGFEESDIEGVPLGEARVVVGGGRGVGSAEDYDQLETLADLLGGTVGSSRAAVNEGWRPHDDQIGLTGTKIAPDIYIACGISGAVQHMVGCKGAQNILAINTDPEAAIIGKAEYAVIGDLHEIVPAITEAVRDAQ